MHYGITVMLCWQIAVLPTGCLVSAALRTNWFIIWGYLVYSFLKALAHQTLEQELLLGWMNLISGT